MPITIYNTLTRTKEPFEPLVAGKVGIYLCGPTVYKPSHIGHAVGPIIFDAVKRYLTFRGYQVTWVVNVTDVDDKLIDEARGQKTTIRELAARVEADYLDAMKKLHVDGIDVMPRASECMGDIIGVIRTLVDKGAAYVADGDVYFDVTSDPDYGKLSNRSIEDQAGQRALHGGQKRNPNDFALWKAAKPGEPEEVKFDSPWGKGRPGWHIECSAMSMKVFGPSLDIHGGGMDLIFPHHENEIAQSESANDAPFAKYWMHNGLTRFNTKKVSKSDTDPEAVRALKRMTLHNLLAEFSPELIRFFVLSTHYRRPIEFSDEELAGKKKGLDTFYRLFERVERITGQSAYAAADKAQLAKPSRDASEPSRDREGAGSGTRLDPVADFIRAMDDDFNTAAAIATLFDAASEVNATIEREKWEKAADDGAKAILLQMTGGVIRLARLLGLFLEPASAHSGGGDDMVDSVMRILIDLRAHCRKKKDFEAADLIRNRLTELGITLEDRADGTGWRKG
ncbi:MAG: cysteine--tRNA ligase [Phycisphaerales bacterium]|nr:MAG: cysteine--tRNA ligase [Phycisphaerales bacterium]